MKHRTPHLLVTSTGRRNYVVEALLRSRPPGGILTTADADALAPSLHIDGADSITLPPFSDASYRSTLIDECVRRSITGLVSLNDYELEALASITLELQTCGVQVIGPTLSIAQRTLDKIATNELFVGSKFFRTPETSNWSAATQSPFPSGSIVKDRWGSGSSGLSILPTLEKANQLAVESQSVAEITTGTEDRQKIIQERIVGTEYNIDIFCRWDGSLSDLCVKEKIRMRGGETDACRVLSNPPIALKNAAMELATFLRVPGNTDIDLIVDADGPVVIDVNPRFGGGFAFANMAGYRAAEHIWRLLDGSEDQIIASTISDLTAAKTIAVVAINGA